MYTYTAYNLNIQSELPLPELLPNNNRCEPDISIRLVDSQSLAQTISNRGDYFVGEVAQVGSFSVGSGSEILVDPEPDVDTAFLRSILLGPIICILLRQRGLLVLHGSSFAAQDEAVGFIGDSGWGKSTLVESFHSQGYRVLTDDVMVIDINADRPMVIPGFPQIKLWPDSASATGHDCDSLSPLHSKTVKRIHKLNQGFVEQALPLKRIYVLDFSDDNQVIPLESQASFAHLVKHTRAVGLLTAPEFINAHFYQCSSLIKNVSICCLQRKRSLGKLQEVVDLVKADLDIINVLKNEQNCLTAS